MKKEHLYIIIASLLLMVFVSCDKFLETTPLDKMDPKEIFDKESQLDAALTATYDIMGRGTLYSYTIPTRFATEGDEGFFYSSSRTTGPQFYNQSSSDTEVLGTWSILYEGIFRANLVLANVDKPKMDETRRKYIKGEALFLRSFYYFLLVSNWGDVPLILEPTKSVEGNAVAQTKAEQIYDRITKDMIEAESLVRPIVGYNGAGHVTKSAVRGILARVYLYWAGYPLRNTSKYVDAKMWAEKVINDLESNHQLNASYDQVFVNYAQEKYDNKESIFEVEFTDKGIGAYEVGQIGSWIGIRSSNVKNPTAYGFIGTTSMLFDRYQVGDLRRDRAIAPYSYGSSETKVDFSATQKSRRYPGKWRRDEELGLKLSQNTPINYPLLRYSDVLLMFAEADFFVNNQTATTEAYEAINQVRRRGYGKYLNGVGNVSETLKSITITNGGAGYTSAPTITITGGGGENAKATATVAGGLITTVTITNVGRRFSSLPTITVSGGGGSGAVLTPLLSSANDADLQGLNSADFLEALQDERSRELCFEGFRKYDLIRWENIESKLKAVGAWIKANEPIDYKYLSLSFDNFNKSIHTLLPIPQNDMSLNKLLKQNHGY